MGCGVGLRGAVGSGAAGDRASITSRGGMLASDRGASSENGGASTVMGSSGIEVGRVRCTGVAGGMGVAALMGGAALDGTGMGGGVRGGRWVDPPPVSARAASALMAGVGSSLGFSETRNGESYAEGGGAWVAAAWCVACPPAVACAPES